MSNRLGADELPVVVPSPTNLGPPPASVPIASEPFAGVLVAANSVDIRAPFSGRVLAVEAQLSGRVLEGEVLARLDPRRRGFEREAAVARARSGKAELRRAEATHKAATREARRTRALHTKGLVSDEALDAAETAQSVATLDVQAARASAQREHAEVAVVDFDAGDATLTAPFAGTIVGRYVSPGERVTEGEALLRLADVGQLVVRFGIGEQELGDVRDGSRVRVSTMKGNEEILADVVSVAAELDPTARLAVAEAVLDEVPSHWAVGATLLVRPLEREAGP